MSACASTCHTGTAGLCRRRIHPPGTRRLQSAAQEELRRITDVKQNAAGYENYQQWLANTQLEQRVSLEDYSVSNRGLNSGLVGTPDRIAERIVEFERAGVELLLL